MTSWMYGNMILNSKLHTIILESILLVLKFEEHSTQLIKQNL